MAAFTRSLRSLKCILLVERLNTSSRSERDQSRKGPRIVGRGRFSAISLQRELKTVWAKSAQRCESLFKKAFKDGGAKWGALHVWLFSEMFEYLLCRDAEEPQRIYLPSN